MKIAVAQASKGNVHMSYIATALNNECDMILFPELFGKNEYNIYNHYRGLIVGHGYEEKTFLGRKYNTYEIHIGDDVLLKYRKQNMFPGYDDGRKPGKKMPCVVLHKLRIYTCICYDIRNPWTFKQMWNPDLIIIPAEFPAERIEDWRRILQLRAKENRTNIIGINTTDGGHSMLVNRQGRIVKEVGTEDGVMLVEVNDD